jgi:hypothetical protein
MPQWVWARGPPRYDKSWYVSRLATNTHKPSSLESVKRWDIPDALEHWIVLIHTIPEG